MAITFQQLYELEADEEKYYKPEFTWGHFLVPEGYTPAKPKSDVLGRDLLPWKYFVINAETYPEYEEEVRNEIKNCLGYRPPLSLVMYHEAYLRTLHHNYVIGKISFDHCKTEFTDTVRKMRNIEMKIWGWVSRGFDDNDHLTKLYETENIHFKDQARERLAYIMKEEPDIRFSMEGEILIRDVYSMESVNMGKRNQVDIKAATITKYREIYFTQGEKAADDSPLFYEIHD